MFVHTFQAKCNFLKSLYYILHPIKLIVFLWCYLYNVVENVENHCAIQYYVNVYNIM